MSVYYLCNVGVRDLALDGDTKGLQPPRAKGQDLLKAYKEHESRFSAPIISPGVEFALKRSGRIDRLVLIATDQSDDVAENYRNHDTIFTAEILKKHLEFKFGGKRIREIKVLPLRGENPAQYDAMYSWFQRIANSKDLPVEGLECCYLSPSGGTPQANFGLMLHAIRAFGDRCEVLAVDSESRAVQPLNIAANLQNSTRKDIVLNHLKTFSFAEAIDVLDQMAAPALARALADYAKHRLYFDFERAKEIAVEAAKTVTGQDRKLCSALRAELEAIEDSGLEALVVELYHNAAITFANQQYVDFLGRCFRFQEATLQLVNNRIYGLALGKTLTEDAKGIVDLVERNTRLNEAFVHTVLGETLDYKKATIPVLKRLADYACTTGYGYAPDGSSILDSDEKASYQKISANLTRISRLSELRNRSIIAHGFKGVSREILLSVYQRPNSNASNPVDDMKFVVESLSLTTMASPFERIAIKIAKLIEKI